MEGGCTVWREGARYGGRAHGIEGGCRGSVRCTLSHAHMRHMEFETVSTRKDLVVGTCAAHSLSHACVVDLVVGTCGGGATYADRRYVEASMHEEKICIACTRRGYV